MHLVASGGAARSGLLNRRSRHVQAANYFLPMFSTVPATDPCPCRGRRHRSALRRLGAGDQQHHCHDAQVCQLHLTSAGCPFSQSPKAAELWRNGFPDRSASFPEVSCRNCPCPRPPRRSPRRPWCCSVCASCSRSPRSAAMKSSPSRLRDRLPNWRPPLEILHWPAALEVDPARRPLRDRLPPADFRAGYALLHPYLPHRRCAAEVRDHG